MKRHVIAKALTVDNKGENREKITFPAQNFEHFSPFSYITHNERITYSLSGAVLYIC
jgi:hypothetical protein